ncbi:hypothetical protein L3N51_02061 [Metallosphaera sp. J1]|nr:hypothetical protein [Metallosphaera javensis (ex Hofmann et al. 2022)]
MWNHVVKNGKIRERQFCLCRECGRKFVEGAKHHHDRSVRERALRMYANGMSMRSPGYFRSHWARYSRESVRNAQNSAYLTIMYNINQSY